MANAMYTEHRQEALSAVASGVLKVLAVSNAYTFSAAHTSLNDVGAGARVHTSVQLTSVTTVAGELDAADLTLTAVAVASAIDALIIYTQAASSASSTLHVFLDTGTGFDVVPNGGNIVITWQGTSPYIYKL